MDLEKVEILPFLIPVSPLVNNVYGGLTITAQTYPISVGVSGCRCTINLFKNISGSNSVFSTITSVGGIINNTAGRT